MKQLFDTFNHAIEPFKLWIDLVAIGTAAAAIAKWVPAVAGLFSIAWLGTQLYDYWIVKRKALNGNERNGDVDS